MILKLFIILTMTLEYRVNDIEYNLQSSSVRDFDDCATRVLGNYEVAILSIFPLQPMYYG